MTYVLTLPLKTDASDEIKLARSFALIQKVHNQTVKESQKRFRMLNRDKQYQKTLAEYSALKKEYESEENSERKEAVKAEISSLSDILTDCRKKAGLTKTDLEKFAKVQQHKYKNYLSSMQVQKEADRVYAGVEKVLFGSGKKLHLKRYYQIDTISQKNHTNGVIFRKADMSIRFMNMIIPVSLDVNDSYAEEALQNKIILVELKRIEFEQGFRYYINLYLEGTAPLKDKNIHGDCETGIDIGVSTAASVSDARVILEELAPDGKDYEREIQNLQQKIDRCLRRDNPDNYKEDGTCKKGKHTWNISKKCRRMKRKVRVLYRKQTAYTYTSHHNLANRIIRTASSITTEKMNWSALAKRSKKTERQEQESEIKTKSGEVRKVHKFKRKKRFGRSVKNRSPGLFQRTLKEKCIQQDIPYREVDTKAFRASQYIHTTGEYVKVPMSQRYKQIGSHKVQRDLYSAWLLKNSDKTLKAPDHRKCIQTFDSFVKMQDLTISCMKYYGISFRQCFGF